MTKIRYKLRHSRARRLARRNALLRAANFPEHSTLCAARKEWRSVPREIRAQVLKAAP